MAIVWFILLALMLTTYTVLDGFDFGAGIVHRFVARTDEERALVVASIGPVWDGNEVWLVAAGGTLVFAFPQAYAAAFSGFYLPLMMVLWLLILRGIAIEFRSREPSPLWAAFFDAVFRLASVVLALVLGVSLGNLLRGVPLDESGFFGAPLFGEHGAIDGYSFLVGLLAVAMLGLHGALWIAYKTEGPVRDRSVALARVVWIVVGVLLVAVTGATAWTQPVLVARVVARPWIWPLPLFALGGFSWILRSLQLGRERAAFLGSVALIAGLLAATAGVLFPDVLRSSLDERFSLTVTGAANDPRGLLLGLGWWGPALLLAIGYFWYLFRSFAGKIRSGEYHHD